MDFMDPSQSRQSRRGQTSHLFLAKPRKTSRSASTFRVRCPAGCPRRA